MIFGKPSIGSCSCLFVSHGEHTSSDFCIRTVSAPDEGTCVFIFILNLVLNKSLCICSFLNYGAHCCYMGAVIFDENPY